jgi:hypothetical protein
MPYLGRDLGPDIQSGDYLRGPKPPVRGRRGRGVWRVTGDRGGGAGGGGSGGRWGGRPEAEQ